VLGVGVPFAGGASARIPARWRNCKTVNAKYHHGVGKVTAHDSTSGEPVTNFTHSKLPLPVSNEIQPRPRPRPRRDRLREAVKCKGRGRGTNIPRRLGA
jgi:hypothetical protein